jgi:hypothetical protein
MGNAKGTRFAILGTPANLLNSPTSASCDLGVCLIKLKRYREAEEQSLVGYAGL